jgi:hypothetical protein
MAETPTDTPTPETPPEVAATTATDDQTVPYERFAAKIAEIRGLEEKLATAAQAVDVARSLQEQLAAATTAHEGAAVEWSQTEALLRAGVMDGEIAELARWRYGKSGTEETFESWLETGAKEDPILKGHLETAPSPAAPLAAPPATTAPPSANQGTRAAPPPRGEFSPESVQAMSVAEVKANYSRIATAWGYRGHDFKQ